MLRQIQLFGLKDRARRLDHALDRLQARYSDAQRSGADAAQIQLEFDNLAVARALVAHRIERLHGTRNVPDAAVRVRPVAAVPSRPGSL